MQKTTVTNRLTMMIIAVALIGVGLASSRSALAKETTATNANSFAKPSNLQIRVPSLSQNSGQKTGEPLHLRGADARQQLLVTARSESGALRDYTRQVSYKVSPAGIVRIDANGLVTPLADGEATITAKSPEGLTAALPVAVEKF